MSATYGGLLPDYASDDPRRTSYLRMAPEFVVICGGKAKGNVARNAGALLAFLCSFETDDDLFRTDAQLEADCCLYVTVSSVTAAKQWLVQLGFISTYQVASWARTTNYKVHRGRIKAALDEAEQAGKFEPFRHKNRWIARHELQQRALAEEDAAPRSRAQQTVEVAATSRPSDPKLQAEEGDSIPSVAQHPSGSPGPVLRGTRRGTEAHDGRGTLTPTNHGDDGRGTREPAPRTRPTPGVIVPGEEQEESQRRADLRALKEKLDQSIESNPRTPAKRERPARARRSG